MQWWILMVAAMGGLVVPAPAIRRRVRRRRAISRVRTELARFYPPREPGSGKRPSTGAATDRQPGVRHARPVGGAAALTWPTAQETKLPRICSQVMLDLGN
ncbi:hypothetical protein [Saccharopolyspora phatthalungensis]|uniref:Uncharacterized protein n=1 Tax=Saccharopolyspora phatthalungensis TaxID=664693 RepID=A0A840Q5G4_9PSEU|nr:hypothetical protein [Saccharopolyspora phatthalungensis]MBB5153968.1 hypothetical protein [Saccharopolyspora phatthalungensis]